MVDSMTEDDLFCKLEMDALIFLNIHKEHPSEPVYISEALGIFLYEFFPLENNKF